MKKIFRILGDFLIYSDIKSLDINIVVIYSTSDSSVKYSFSLCLIVSSTLVFYIPGNLYREVVMVQFTNYIASIFP